MIGAKQYESCYPHFSEDKHLTDNQIEKLTDSIKQAFIPIDPIVKKDLKQIRTLFMLILYKLMKE
jgi:hypothetical protein